MNTMNASYFIEKVGHGLINTVLLAALPIALIAILVQGLVERHNARNGALTIGMTIAMIKTACGFAGPRAASSPSAPA